MGTCWYCYWGWPKTVADIYDRALIDLGGNESPLKYGPSHIVWSDENFDSAEWCLENFEKYVGDYSDKELDIVRRSLVELSDVPINTRDIWPSEYDDENP